MVTTPVLDDQDTAQEGDTGRMQHFVCMKCWPVAPCPGWRALCGTVPTAQHPTPVRPADLCVCCRELAPTHMAAHHEGGPNGRTPQV